MRHAWQLSIDELPPLDAPPSIGSSARPPSISDADAFGRWHLALLDDHRVPLEQHPERVCLDALVPAWRTGLVSIIQLPYLGNCADRRDQATLVVSRTTRHAPALYRKALRLPASR